MKLLILNGTLVLFMANFIIKIIGAVYRIPLSNMLGAEGIGLYQLSFPLYSFLLTFITSGIGITLTRRIAKLRSSNNMYEINKQFSMANTLSNWLGGVLTLVILILAYPLAYVQGNENAVFGYIAISLGFIFACKLGANRGYFQGFGNMFPTAVSQILEQVVKLILGLLLAYLLGKIGVVFGVIGAISGVAFGEIFAVIYFKRKIKGIKSVKFSKTSYLAFIKEFMSVGVNYSILPLSNLIDSFLIINLLKMSGISVLASTEYYGVYSGMILPLINMPNVLISAIALTSIPQISYAMAKNENVSEKIGNIFKVSFMFILPCVVGIYILSEPILKIVYPTLSLNQLTTASTLLKYASFEMFFLCFLGITNALMQALDKTKQATKSLLLGLLVKIGIMFLTMPNIGISIYGAVISNIFAYFIPCLYNLVLIKKATNSRLEFKNVITSIFAVIIMSVIIVVAKNLFGSLTIFELFAIISCSALIYFLLLLAVKQWSIKDIKKLLQKG